MYLLDVKADYGSVRLNLYDPSENVIKEIQDVRYKPYFLIPYPCSQEDGEIIQRLKAESSIVMKQDLFTGEIRKVTRIKIDNPSHVQLASELFKRTWESEVPPSLGYIYDKDLTFGIPYTVEKDMIRPIYEVSSELKSRFKEKFKQIEKTDPLKYDLIERWFSSCSQLIPEVPLEELGIKEKVDRERYYLAFTLSRVANLPLSTAFSSRRVSAWVRSIFHSYLRRRNILIPTSTELGRGEMKGRVQGALTFQPKSGVYFNTVVVDFESLYPSLIDAYNLSYETVNCDHSECVRNRVPGLDYHVCNRRRGVYSVLIGALKDLRIRWFKPLSKDKSLPTQERRLAEATSRLLKLILVSSYGVTVRIHGLAQTALAESITAYGRHALKETWNLAVRAGLQPIYGDTDSLFLDDPTDEEVEWLINTVKKKLQLDLAVDKKYSICVLPRAMKAYFGIQRDGTPDIKGVTAIKSNSPPFIQRVFKDCIEELREVKNWTEFEMAKKRIQEVVKASIEDLKAGRVPIRDLRYTMRLHFDPSEKMVEEEMLHQPYQCAVQLIDLGRKLKRGDKISFVKVKPFLYKQRTFTVKPTNLVKSLQEINMDDYERNLRTALNQIFKPMSIWLGKEKVAKLTDFL